MLIVQRFSSSLLNVSSMAAMRTNEFPNLDSTKSLSKLNNIIQI
jgi:hypothetical protein